MKRERGVTKSSNRKHAIQQGCVQNKQFVKRLNETDLSHERLYLVKKKYSHILDV